MNAPELIEAAAKKFGNETKLLNYLGYSKSYLSQVKVGKVALRPVIQDALRHIVEGEKDGVKTTTVYVISTDETVEQIRRLGDSYTELAKTLFDCTRQNISWFTVSAALSTVAIGLLLWEAARHFWG